MNSDIKNAIDEFLVEFKNLSVVKKYLALKDKMKNDEYFLALKKEVKENQKQLALSIGKDNYQENKEKYEKSKEIYENHPFNINYLVYEKEIHHLLKEIELNIK